MNWISFRGVRTDDLGLLIAQMPNPFKAEQRMTEYEIPGRDGAVHIADGYRPFDLTVTLTMLRQDARMRQTINAWADGTGQLVTSDQPDLYYTATVQKAVTYERRAYNGAYYDTARVVFRCQPIMHETNPRKYTFTGSGRLINIGTVKALPTVTITGSGDCSLMIGVQEITLHNVDMPVTIDCGAGYVHTATGGAEMEGEFFEIPLGLSPVTLGGGTQRVVIEPNWGWL